MDFTERGVCDHLNSLLITILFELVLRKTWVDLSLDRCWNYFGVRKHDFQCLDGVIRDAYRFDFSWS